MIQIHVQGQDPNVSLHVRGRRTRRMPENISASCKYTYQSKMCSNSRLYFNNVVTGQHNTVFTLIWYALQRVLD